MRNHIMNRLFHRRTTKFTKGLHSLVMFCLLVAVVHRFRSVRQGLTEDLWSFTDFDTVQFLEQRKALQP